MILTTGGFINNDAMIAAHQPLVRRCKFRVGAEGDDGSGIRLGIAAGAATLHMDAASISLPATQPWGLKAGILVNAQGQRFINEDAYYGRLGEWALFHHGGKAWLRDMGSLESAVAQPMQSQGVAHRGRPGLGAVWRCLKARVPADQPESLRRCGPWGSDR